MSQIEDKDKTKEGEEQILSPLLSQIERAEAESVAKEAEAARLLNDYRTIAEQGGAARSALMAQAEPKKDERRERAITNVAKAQAWGDMLTALTSGIVANTGKYGKGYMPYVPSGSALDSIGKLNELQKEYQQRKMAWDEKMLNFDLAKEAAKVEAARSLATTAAQDAKDARTRARKVQDDAVKGVFDWNKFVLEEEGRNKRAQYAQDSANARTAATIAAADARAKNNKTAENKTAENRKADILQLAAMFGLQPTAYEVTTTRREGGFNAGTETKSGVRTKSSDELLQEAYADERIQAAIIYMDNGYTLQEAYDMVMEDQQPPYPYTYYPQLK